VYEFDSSLEAFSDRASLIEARGRGGSLVDADLSFLNLIDIDLSNLDLSGVLFTGSCLKGANLEGCNLQSTFVQDADLDGVSLQGADLQNGFMQRVQFNDADFSAADISGASLLLCSFQRAKFSAAKLGQKFFAIGKAHFACRSAQRFVGRFFTDMLKCNTGEFLAKFDIFFAMFFAHRASNGSARPTGFRNFHPACQRPLSGCGLNLDRLPVAQSGPKGHALTVNLGPYARVSDPRVNRIGKINRCRPARQFDHIPLGRETKYLIGKHFELHMLKKFLVIIMAFHPLM
jgi:hypothetical protein